MSRPIKVGEVVVDHFSVFDFDGYTKKTGETVFASTLWKNGVVSALPVAIAEIGSSGEYKIEFTPDTEGVWSVNVLIDYNKDWWGAEYVAEITAIDEIYEMVRRVLGLGQENIYIDNTVYDPGSQLVGSRVRIFDSKANCDAATPGGSETTGLIATYLQGSAWASQNEFTFYKQTKEP